MDNFKEAFVAYMKEKDIKFEDLDERAVRLRFRSDVVAQGVEILVIFDKENHHIGETVRVRITGSTSATLLGEALAGSQIHF